MKRAFMILLCALLVLQAAPALAEEIPSYMYPAGYVEGCAEGNLLVVMTSDGRRFEQEIQGEFLTDDLYMGYSGSVTRSPDGLKALICTFDMNEYRLRSVYLFDGDALTLVCENIPWQTPQLSADAARVLYYTEDRLLYCWENGAAGFVTEDFVTRWCGFSADGDKVFYSRTGWTAAGDAVLNGCLYDCASRGEEAAVENGVILSVSADDRVIMYYGVDMEEEDVTGIFVRNAETGEDWQLTPDDEAMIFANLDQDEFLIMRDDGEKSAWVCLDGAEPVKIASDETRPILPYGTYREGGTLGVSSLRGMYFTSRTPDDLARIIRIGEDGTAVTVAQGVSEDHAYLLEDGRTLLLLKNGGIRRMDGLEPSGAPEILISGDILEFVPSADGETLFYTTAEGGISLYALAPGGEPVLLRQDSDRRLGQDNIFGGSALYFTADGKLYRSDGGAPEIALETEGNRLWNIACGPYSAQVLDFSTALGESSYGAGILFSWDGRSFFNVGEVRN